MALVPVCLISLTILLHFVTAQQTNGTVSVGASLTATPNATPWLSSSGEFALGFQQVQGKDNFLLSIWYDKINEKTIIWYPEGGSTVSTGSKVDLLDGRGLVLSDPQGKEVWSSGSISDLAYGYMNDTGNFVIVGSNSRNIWESFDHPADTMLPTQVMVRGGEINSKRSKTNFTGGKFQLRLLLDGNLVLNTRDRFTGTPDNPYYISGTSDASNSTNSGYQLIFDATGYMYILSGNGERFNLTKDFSSSGAYYHRATLDSDGVFTQYYYPKNPTGPTSWKVVWFVPENICTSRDSKACGLNNICILDENRPNCECPKGFSLLDPNTPNGDCKPFFTPTCDEGEPNQGVDVFDFYELTNIDWPQSDFLRLNPSSEETCRTSCLKDCFCAVAIYRDNRCWMKQLPLTNGFKDPAYNVKAFLKFRKIDGSVSVGASLTATPDAKPWLSSSGEFAMGFKQVQGKDKFLLSIWYDKITEKTIIWYPEGGPTVSTGSKVDLLDGRGLVLSDPQGKEVWSSGSISDLAYGYMNDTGNFVIVGSNSRNIWESFDHPADTMLPTQVMVRGGEINSKSSKTNFTGGKFQLRLLPDGNLVLNTRDMFTGTPDNAYYLSGTHDASNSTNSGYQLIFDATGYMYILRGNGERFNLTKDFSSSGAYYHRATLDSDGVFTQYYYPKNPTEPTSWKVVWFVPENICTSRASKACGLNNICILDENRPNCECPPGFSLLDPNTPNGDCKPFFTPTCDEGDSNKGSDVFDFYEFTNIDWPESDFVSLNPSSEETCKTSCLKDCFCAVAIYRDNRCWKKQLPLTNGYKDPAYNVKALVKHRKIDGPSETGKSRSGTGEEKSGRTLIFIGSTLLGTSVLGIVVFIGVIYVFFFQVDKKAGNLPSSTTVETNLPRFTYQELVKATDGFKDELGKGAIGIVYKGVIGTKIVAVKKLASVVQDGQKEFKTEANTIARTHHKNLVQLLGYCDDGEQLLLIYEYISNGTLASFLFGDMRPSWKQRSYIALGIAKGLTYLHDDCNDQIIHCDIKPQNILLDDYYNAKIADFGLAKLLKINQSRTDTGIRGTKGYVAPEWFRNTLVTSKVDVYSFGVVIFEIISCRKSLIFDDAAEDMPVLTDLAWDCYQEGRLDAFVKNDLEALDDLEKLRTFMMVGLWCVQENPSLRPTMKKVIQILEGVIEVTEPPCPFPFSVTY